LLYQKLLSVIAIFQTMCVFLWPKYGDHRLRKIERTNNVLFVMT